jgi:cytochrome c oxidase subunit IV
MSATDVEHIKRQTKVYLYVFFGLMVLTVLTVMVSYFHLPVVFAVVVALLIASVKGGLVASYFMHLVAERKAIYYVLLLTVIFFLVLIFAPLSGYLDRLGR